MADKIKCTIVTGAPNDCSDFLKANIDNESFVIAADSGYCHLLKADIIPDLIIADFDSSEKPDINCEIITFPVEKAYTDTFNCVRFAVEKGYREIEILNALGSRFDHSLANVLCLDYCKKHHVQCRLTDKNNRITLIEKRCSFKKEYENFSLFAFLEDCKGVRIKGAYYTAGWYGKESLDIHKGEQFALSNFVNAKECEITLESGTLLLIESND